MVKFPAFILLTLLAFTPNPSVAYQNVIQRTIQKTPEIDWWSDNDEIQGHCSGIQVGVRWVLTAKHCLPPNDGIDVQVNHHPARLVRSNIAFALFETATDAANGIIDLRKTPLEVGEALFALGYAWDEPIYVLQRSVARLGPANDQMPQICMNNEYVYTDGTFIEGMSGGPVVDMDGKLVGVIQAGTKDIGIACPASDVKRFLDGK